MEEKFLKGNFETKRKVTISEDDQRILSNSEKIAKDLKDTVLQALSGSMVYVERTQLFWDGSNNKKGQDK